MLDLNPVATETSVSI